MRTKWLLIALPLIVVGVLLQSALWVPTYASQTRGNPERLRTFLRASIGDAKLLNPILSANAAASEVMDNNIFEGLVVGDENLNLVGKLADHWQISEDAYVAALPDRKLVNGLPATAANIAALLDEAWKGARLGGMEASIQGLDVVPAETRTTTETALVDNEKGKQAPLDIELSVAVPERVRLRLSKVEAQLFRKLEPALGAGYFAGSPLSDRVRAKKPEQLRFLRDKLSELLAVGEHNPVVTFFLHSGVRWHDGVPFTAEDVKFTYQALVDPRNASPRSSSFEGIKSVEVLDELTARVTYKRLYAPAIIDWQIGIIPKHSLDDAGLSREKKQSATSKAEREALSIRNSVFNRSPIGTGPFRFAEWRQDQFIRLARNDDYWGRKAEYQELFFRVIPDYLTMELEFQAGALDRYEALPHQAARYRKNAAYHVLDRRRGYYSYIGYNTRRPLFQDARMRRALGMAIDVDSVIKYVLSGEGKRSTGPFYSNTPFNDPSLQPLRYDPQAALALLAELGWKKNARGMLEKDGKPLEFTLVTNNGNPQRKAILTIAQEAWRKLGIDCKIQTFEWTVFLEDFIHKLNFDAVVLAWVGGDINPDKYQLWHSSQAGPFQLNFSGYKNPRVDALIEAIREEYDFDKQVSLTHQVHRLIAEDQPFTFLYEPTEPIALDTRIVQIEHAADGRESYRKIEPTATGSIDYYFTAWRKLAQEPAYAP